MMTVREKTGRRRFILFKASENTGLGMGRIISLFNRRFRETGFDKSWARFRVIFFEKEVGIVRCSHLATEDVIALINSSKLENAELRTLRTSGTLKTLKDWLRTNRGIMVPGKSRGQGVRKTLPGRAKPGNRINRAQD